MRGFGATRVDGSWTLGDGATSLGSTFSWITGWERTTGRGASGVSRTAGTLLGDSDTFGGQSSLIVVSAGEWPGRGYSEECTDVRGVDTAENPLELVEVCWVDVESTRRPADAVFHPRSVI